MTPHPAAVGLLHMFGKPERHLIHFAPREGLVIALLRSNRDPELYDLIVAFTVDDRWHATIVLHDAEAPEVFGELAKHINNGGTP